MKLKIFQITLCYFFIFSLCSILWISSSCSSADFNSSNNPTNMTVGAVDFAIQLNYSLLNRFPTFDGISGGLCSTSTIGTTNGLGTLCRNPSYSINTTAAATGDEISINVQIQGPNNFLMSHDYLSNEITDNGGICVVRTLAPISGTSYITITLTDKCCQSYKQKLVWITNPMDIATTIGSSTPVTDTDVKRGVPVPVFTLALDPSRTITCR